MLVLLAASSALLSCGDELGPIMGTETYTLRSVDGAAAPFILSDEAPGGARIVMEQLGDSIILLPHSRLVVSRSLQTTFYIDGVPYPGTNAFSSTGSFTVTGPPLQKKMIITFDGGFFSMPAETLSVRGSALVGHRLTGGWCSNGECSEPQLREFVYRRE